MLVITRKVGETIVIGEGSSITIADIQKGKVKVAIDAPREITVYRKEILEEVRAANQDSGLRRSPAELEGLAGKIFNEGKTEP